MRNEFFELKPTPNNTRLYKNGVKEVTDGTTKKMEEYEEIINW